jgi:cyclophilin family peptidyl-prolyl cis-trans isomerase
MGVQAPDIFDVIFSTNLYGTFAAECKRDRAPVWVDRVYNLVLNGYYNDNYFFRVIPEKYIQFGTNGYPDISNCYNFASPDIKPCAILEPQPNDMPINTNGIHGLSNVFGTVSMSTSYNETTETTWNATAELFINIGNNSQLDDMLFVPICTISPRDMNDVVLAFPSFGEVQELGGDGISLDMLYAEGNEYIQSNPEWATMAETSRVRVACSGTKDSKDSKGGTDSDTPAPVDSICGPCIAASENDGSTTTIMPSISRSFPYDYFSTEYGEWRCPEVGRENDGIVIIDGCNQ